MTAPVAPGQPGTPPVVTLLTFPSGLPVTLFSALAGFVSAGLGEDADVVLKAPASHYENSTVVVNNLTARQITRRLNDAGDIIADEERPHLADEDGLPVVTLGSALQFPDDGGATINVGFDDLTRDQGRAMLGTIAKTIGDELADNPLAVNYLEWSWYDDDTRRTYRLIMCKPGQPTPHELRQEADRETARYRALLEHHGIDADQTLDPDGDAS